MARVQLLGPVWMGLILLRGSVSRQSQLCTDPCYWSSPMWSLCFSVAGTEYKHWCWFLQSTTEQFTCLTLSDNIAKHCYLTAGHTELHLRDGAPLSDISTAQRRSAYENLSFHYVTKWAESELPVGELFYQWVGCRDHAGIIYFPNSGSWQAQGGPVYICKDQRKRVIHYMGPLRKRDISWICPFTWIHTKSEWA